MSPTPTLWLVAASLMCGFITGIVNEDSDRRDMLYLHGQERNKKKLNQERKLDFLEKNLHHIGCS